VCDEFSLSEGLKRTSRFHETNVQCVYVVLIILQTEVDTSYKISLLQQ
jgi:hypothetical protein